MFGLRFMPHSAHLQGWQQGSADTWAPSPAALLHNSHINPAKHTSHIVTLHNSHLPAMPSFRHPNP